MSKRQLVALDGLPTTGRKSTICFTRRAAHGKKYTLSNWMCYSWHMSLDGLHMVGDR